MRINPIMVKNHYSPTQKINFGMIDNKKTEELTYNMMMKELDWYDDIIKRDPNCGYKEDKEYVQEKLDYFKASRLFTLKSKKDTKNKDVLYVVMNKEEVDKHEQKELFDEMIKRCKDFYDPSKQDYTPPQIAKAQRAGLPGDEKEFLKILFDYSSIDSFYNEMQLREQGERPEPPKTASVNTTSVSDKQYDQFGGDKSYEAYVRYGV